MVRWSLDKNIFPPQLTADATSTVCLKFAAEQKAKRLPVNVCREGEVLPGLTLSLVAIKVGILSEVQAKEDRL